MTIRFDARIAGYLWIFPRTDHLAVGACGSLGQGAAETLWQAARDLPATLDVDGSGLPRYSALIPTLGPDALRANVVAGPGWSLVGDAAGTVDPLTREGIRHAIRSADLLGDAFEAGSPGACRAGAIPSRVHAAFHGPLDKIVETAPARHLKIQSAEGEIPGTHPFGAAERP